VFAACFLLDEWLFFYKRNAQLLQRHGLSQGVAPLAETNPGLVTGLKPTSIVLDSNSSGPQRVMIVTLLSGRG
jgi:hypothetical protein